MDRFHGLRTAAEPGRENGPWNLESCMLGEARVARAGLLDIRQKLDAGERLTLRDGVRLFECPDMLALGWLANREREKRHGGNTFYNHNIRLEATNVCVANCLFCSFARLMPGDADAYTLSLEQALQKLRARAHEPITEVHVVNGLHPDLPFDYYTSLLRGLKAIKPSIHLKCFTAVEIAFFADLYGMTDEQVLRALMAAGLDSLPGGGAEVFASRVRQKICADKCGADRWLAIHRTRPRPRHALERDDALRAHRDVRGARRSHAARAGAAGRDGRVPGVHPPRVPPRQQPDAQAAGADGRPRRCACTPWRVSMLDNVAHVKAFWIATGIEVAQASLWFGVDDLDGTVQEEKIYHMAGARTPEMMTTREIQAVIRAAGRSPVERDTLYNVVA